jgi:pimeloyl-ACP methyl ester carboxylesterase
VPPTLLIVGAEDHTVPLYNYATKPEDLAPLGDFPALAAAAARDIPRGSHVVLPDCGHVPHLETPDGFLAALIPFLAS